MFKAIFSVAAMATLMFALPAALVDRSGSEGAAARDHSGRGKFKKAGLGAGCQLFCPPGSMEGEDCLRCSPDGVTLVDGTAGLLYDDYTFPCPPGEERQVRRHGQPELPGRRRDWEQLRDAVAPQLQG